MNQNPVIFKATFACPNCRQETLFLGLAENKLYCSRCYPKNLGQLEEELKTDYNKFFEKLIKLTRVMPMHLGLATHPVVAAYAAGQGKLNLWFYGAVGTGKTTNAIWLAIELYKQGYRPIYAKSYEIIDNIKSYLNCNFLIIDEMQRSVRIFGQTPSHNDQTELFKLIEHRLTSGLKTVFISNFGKSGMLPLIGDESYSRMASRRDTAVIFFEGEDYRANEGD